MSSDTAEGTSLAERMSVRATETPLVFTGATEDYAGLGIYGGHYLGQALAAGFKTVEEPKLAHSFHAYFLRRGDPQAQLDYHVASLRESRGGDVRAIPARQNGMDVFHMLASFKLPEPGDEHQKNAPDIASAEAVVAAREKRGEPSPPFPITKGGRVQMEFASASFRNFDPSEPPALQTWMRVLDDKNLSERERQTVLAFLSDGTLMFNSVLPYGQPFQTHRLTSLDHSAWFHRGTDPTDWLLFDQRSTAAADGRGMNEGEIYTSDGQLVMTCAQESMLRRIKLAA